MTKRQTTIITFLSVIVFILCFLVTHRLWFRLDLTKTKAYTISKVSRNLYTEIPDYVNITYFLSDRLKTIVPMPGEIEDTLREFAAFSKGKIRVTVRDPIKAGLSSALEELGFQPRQVQTVEKDQASFITVYSGIVIEYLDKMEVLPWVISTDTLEYDITSRIRSMVMDVERRIGVIVGDSFRNWREDFTYLNQVLAEAGYRVRLINPGDEIPDNLPALFVLGGVEDMDIFALYRIDRYIRQGGKILFAVKGIYVDTAGGSIAARRQQDQGLLDMLASYGVIVRPELALDRNALTLQYQTMLASGAVQLRIVRYPFWIGVSAENGNREHPVSANFSGLDLYWASPLEINAPAQVQTSVLFTSTNQAWSMVNSFNTNPEISYLFERDANETRGVKILGASLSGIFPSFFQGAPKPAREDWYTDEYPQDELPDMPLNAIPSRIIVVGDTDFATNMINASGASYNLEFLLRAADWLASDDDIISIRNKLPYIGRFDKIKDEETRASYMRFSQILNIGIVPFFVILAGMIIASKRRSRIIAEIKSAKEAAGDI
ncbi:MAG: GldG family protein [Treponema sp.]|nr:GldG family protein [Treponema sp.]